MIIKYRVSKLSDLVINIGAYEVAKETAHFIWFDHFEGCSPEKEKKSSEIAQWFDTYADAKEFLDSRLKSIVAGLEDEYTEMLDRYQRFQKLTESDCKRCRKTFAL